ncbi:MAG: diguanylate cyclase, partial [Cyanobacteria bacterium]|nr:diguanylate cyclase [Cyanobacteriota bacterium]
EAERKQVEAALIKSEAQSRAILAAIPDLIVVLSPEGIYRSLVNPHIGFDCISPEVDRVGMHITDVLPPNLAQRYLYYLQKAFETGELQVFEQQLQVEDRLQDEEIRAIKSSADTVLLMIRDISERKRLEAERRAAEQQLQNLIEGTAATIGQDFFPALVRHIAQALQVSYALVTEQVGSELRTLGFWANGALQPTYLYGIAHTPCEQALRAGYFYCQDSVQARFPQDSDLVDMQAESYLGVVLQGSDGQAIGHLCIMNQQGIPSPERATQILRVFAARAAAELERQRSTTALEQLNQALEAKVAERTAALQEREQFLQTVLDTFPLSVFWKTKNSVYLGGNRNFLRDAGLDSVADLIGKTDDDLPCKQTEAAAYRRDDRQVITSGIAKLGIVETQVLANGQQAWIETNKLPLHNLAGEVIGVLGTYQDITARQRDEVALQNLISGTAATTGQDFFPALVRHIAEALGVSYALVTERVDTELQSLAFWADGSLKPNFAYPSAHTPCGLVIQTGELYCASAVCDRFPEDSGLVDLAAESYLGVALYGSQGQAIGNLCILDRHPIPDAQRAQQILGVFAARAAAELERQRASTALEQLNQALETKVAERTAELQEREQFLQTVLDTFPLMVFWKDRNLVYRGGNRNFLKNAGLASLEELDGKTDYDLPWTTAEAVAYRADDLQVIESNMAKLDIIETQHRVDGCEIWSETNKLPLHNLEGEVIGILGTYQDITDRKAAEAAIKQQLAAIEAASDGIGILQNGTYTYVNQAHLSLFGYDQPEALLGQSWQTLYAPGEVARFQREVFPLLARDRAWQGEGIATRKDGSTFAQGISLTLTEDDLLICVCRDISEIKQAQAQITHNALHDPLTGLPNRTLLIDRIELAIHRAQRLQNHQYAVLFLDLDRFKVINDSLGHSVGDQLLIAISERLKVHLRNIDVVARLGGDEFVILLENIHTTEEVVQVAERILADGRNPFILNGHEIFTSFSIGIVMGKAHYQQAADLIRDADIAMYRAKAKLHNSYKFFDADMHVQVLQRLTLETDLRRALEHQEFIPYYQPIFDLADSRLVGFEALIRWQHPSRGLIAPDQFITVAEETGLIVAIDRWMFHQSCQQMVRWQGRFGHHFPLKISIIAVANCIKT